LARRKKILRIRVPGKGIHNEFIAFSSTAERRRQEREREREREREGRDPISHPPTTFRARNHRLIDNWTIIIQYRDLFPPFSAVLGRLASPPCGPPLPPPPPLHCFFSRYRIARSFHLYFGVLATLCLTREFPWLRYPGEEPIGFLLALHLSLLRSLSPSLSPSLSFSLHTGVRRARLSFSHALPRLVRRSAAIMTPRGGEYAVHQDRLHSWLHVALIPRCPRR